MTTAAAKSNGTLDAAAEEWRAACLAEVSAETAEWIAGNLQGRVAPVGIGQDGSVQRIRQQAARHRENARRHWARAQAMASE